MSEDTKQDSKPVFLSEKHTQWQRYIQGKANDAMAIFKKKEAVTAAEYSKIVEEVKSFLKHTLKNGDQAAIVIGNACPTPDATSSDHMRHFAFRLTEHLNELKKKIQAFDLADFKIEDLF